MNKAEIAEVMRRRRAPVEEYIDACVMDHVLGFEPLPEHVIEVVQDKPGVLFQAIGLAKTALEGVNSQKVDMKFAQLSNDVDIYRKLEHSKNSYGSSATTAEYPANQSWSVRTNRSGRTYSIGDRSVYVF